MTRTLAPQARWVWRLEQLALWLALEIGGVIAAQQVDGVLAALVRILPLAGLVLGTALVPSLRWRRWRWELQPEAIEIRHGVFTVRHTLVPMLRVQHVDTTSGLVQQAFGLATVVIHTAAGSHEIPLLRTVTAEEVRDRIARLAGTADEP